MRSSFIALLVVSIGVSYGAAQENIVNYRFDRMWPTPQQPWYFGDINGLAVDSEGSVYIADLEFQQVLKFSQDGALVYTFILPFDAEGSPLISDAVATSSDQWAYVLDPAGQRVLKIDRSSGVVEPWLDLPFDFFPVGVAVDEYGNVYISDGYGNRVDVFTEEGNYERTIGRGVLRDPAGLAVLPGGTLLVADKGNTRIQAFSAGGAPAYVFEQPPGISGDLFYNGIAAAPDGTVYTTLANGNAPILVFESDGQFREGLPLTNLGAVAIGRDGELLAGTRPFSSLLRLVVLLSPESDLLGVWTSGGGTNGKFNRPNDLVALNGEIFVADQENRRIQVFDEGGRFLRAWPIQGEQKPLRIARGPSDSLHVLGIDGTFAYTATGELQWTNSNSLPLDIAVLPDGRVLVMEAPFLSISVYNADGEFETIWTPIDALSGEFFQENFEGYLEVDSTGSIYVIAPNNNWVRKLNDSGEVLYRTPIAGFPNASAITPDDQLMLVSAERTQFLSTDGTRSDAAANPFSKGTGTGQTLTPSGIAFLENGEMVVTDRRLNRVQKYRPVTLAANAKAIVVAAGGAFPGNNLWNTTQFCANFAYRALNHQGFSKDEIYYLSSDLDLDLDNNGAADDVDANATSAALEYALTEWAADAGSLLVYLVDHGGDDTFRLSGTETLAATALGQWLDTAGATIGGTLTVVYDACQSGSFVEELEGPNRIVITSSNTDENAYFLSTGTISFSNFFWTHIFNGYNVQESFSVAAAAISQTVGFQTPQFSDPGGLAGTTFIGNGTEITGDRPEIRAISAPQTVAEGSGTAELFVTVADDDGIARVWAVITPPGFAPPSPDNPIQDLPRAEFFPSNAGDRWDTTYEAFTMSGTYQIAVYARDQVGNISLPRRTTVSVGTALRDRAVLVAGAPSSAVRADAQETALRAAFEALQVQGYRENDLHVLAASTFLPVGVNLPTRENLAFALTEWVDERTRNVVVYFIGEANFAELVLDDGERVQGDEFSTWLDSLQANVPGTVTVLIDASESASFLPELATSDSDARRIVMASAGAGQRACQLPERNLSFSNYFWRRVLNGATVEQAFTHAAIAMDFSASQHAELDDNGDGIFDTRTDGVLARRTRLGAGVLLAGDDPLIGRVNPERTLNGESSATLWAEDVTTTGTIEAVYAVIQFPGDAKDDDCTGKGVDVVELLPRDGRYEGRYDSFTEPGEYEVVMVAVDNEDAVSLPEPTRVNQTMGGDGTEPDMFEDDDTPESASLLVLDGPSQAHNFHTAGDEDWMSVFLPGDTVVTIETFNLETATDTVLTVLHSDGQTVLETNDNRGPGDLSSMVLFRVEEAGAYFVRVEPADSGSTGAASGYEIRAFRETAPALPGGIIGEVVDAGSGAGVAGAEIELTSIGGNLFNLTNATNSRGEFAFIDLDTGSYRVSVNAQAYPEGDEEIVNVTAGQYASITLSLGESDSTEGEPGGEGEGEGEGEQEGEDGDDGNGKGSGMSCSGADGPADGRGASSLLGDGLLVALLFLALLVKAKGSRTPGS